MAARVCFLCRLQIYWGLLRCLALTRSKEQRDQSKRSRRKHLDTKWTNFTTRFEPQYRFYQWTCGPTRHSFERSPSNIIKCECLLQVSKKLKAIPQQHVVVGPWQPRPTGQNPSYQGTMHPVTLCTRGWHGESLWPDFGPQPVMPVKSSEGGHRWSQMVCVLPVACPRQSEGSDLPTHKGLKWAGKVDLSCQVSFPASHRLWEIARPCNWLRMPEGRWQPWEGMVVLVKRPKKPIQKMDLPRCLELQHNIDANHLELQLKAPPALSWAHPPLLMFGLWHARLKMHGGLCSRSQGKF